MAKKRSSKRARALIPSIVVAVLVIGAAGVASVVYLNSRDSAVPDLAGVSSDAPPPAQIPSESASATPSDAPSETSSAPAVPPAQQTVTPFIASSYWNAGAAQVEVSAFVPAVVESGGLCTAVLEQNGVTLTGSATAIASAQSSDCGDISVAIPSDASGVWNVSVGYSSDSSAGSAPGSSVEITR